MLLGKLGRIQRQLRNLNTRSLYRTLKPLAGVSPLAPRGAAVCDRSRFPPAPAASANREVEKPLGDPTETAMTP